MRRENRVVDRLQKVGGCGFDAIVADEAHRPGQHAGHVLHSDLFLVWVWVWGFEVGLRSWFPRRDRNMGEYDSEPET